jgi:hypothetical protein
MPTPRSFFASSAVLLLAACGSTGPRPVDPRDVEGPGHLGGETVTPPGIPGVASIGLSCKPEKVDCNGYPFEMQIVGDEQKGCRVTPDANAPGTEKVSVQITNKTDPSVNILLSFDGYNGSGRYPLDHVNDRHVWVAKGLSVPSWGPEDATCTSGSWSYEPTQSTHRAGAPDPSCGADACQVQVMERDPTASPRKLELHVSCDTMCVNNDDVTCTSTRGQYIEFDFNAECTN